MNEKNLKQLHKMDYQQRQCGFEDDSKLLNWIRVRDIASLELLGWLTGRREE